MKINPQSVSIRKAVDGDFDAIWDIFHQVIQTEDTYIYPKDTSKQAARQICFAPELHVYVAVLEGKVVGFFKMCPIRTGLGSHIANAAYMVHPDYRGRRIGKMMGEFSLVEAKKLGYRAMQFNIVVSTNTIAVNLWKAIGFDIIGTVPGGYKHSKHGYVDSYIMFRTL